MRNLVFHSINAKTSVFGKYRCFLQFFFLLKVQMPQSRTTYLNLIQLSLSWTTTFDF